MSVSDSAMIADKDLKYTEKMVPHSQPMRFAVQHPNHKRRLIDIIICNYSGFEILSI